MWHSRFQVATFFKSAKAKSVRSATDPVLNPLIPPTLTPLWGLRFHELETSLKRVSTRWISPVTTGSCTWARVGTSQIRWQMTNNDNIGAWAWNGPAWNGPAWILRDWKCTERFGKVWKTSKEKTCQNSSASFYSYGRVCHPFVTFFHGEFQDATWNEWCECIKIIQNQMYHTISHYISIILYHFLSLYDPAITWRRGVKHSSSESPGNCSSNSCCPAWKLASDPLISVPKKIGKSGNSWALTGLVFAGLF